MQAGENVTPEKYLECSITISIQCRSFQKIGLSEHLGTILFLFNNKQVPEYDPPYYPLCNIEVVIGVSYQSAKSDRGDNGVRTTR